MGGSPTCSLLEKGGTAPELCAPEVSDPPGNGKGGNGVDVVVKLAPASEGRCLPVNIFKPYPTMMGAMLL